MSQQGGRGIDSHIMVLKQYLNDCKSTEMEFGLINACFMSRLTGSPITCLCSSNSRGARTILGYIVGQQWHHHYMIQNEGERGVDWEGRVFTPNQGLE